MPCCHMLLHLVDDQVQVTSSLIHRHWFFPGFLSPNTTSVTAKAPVKNFMRVVVATNTTGTDLASDKTATFAAAQRWHEDGPVNNDYDLAAEYESRPGL